ncbi:hypothetical protein DITRI_Ditri15bG0035200 [Diplodiscus trichospermus]
MDSSDYPQINIVMLPYMAHGHFIPYLALARQIHHRTGFNVTVATTPLNIQFLRSTLHHENSSSSGIHLAELPFNSADHGLPPNAENTENLPFDQIGKFLVSSLSLRTPFHDFLLDIIVKQGKPPLCIISDLIFGWAVDVATSTGTVNITFPASGAYGILAYVPIWLNIPHRQTDSEEFGLPGFLERCRFHVSQLHKFMRNADGSYFWSRFMQPQLSGSLQSFGWLCNTVEEIEPLGLDLLRKYANFPVWAIGPLLPKQFLNKSLSSPSLTSSSIHRQREGKAAGISPEKCLQWLDLRGLDSVLYICFGSQNTISPSQMMELAIGLEESGNPFIWVIRPPLGFDLQSEFKAEWLPEGSVFKPLWVEFNIGKLKPRCENDRVANGSRAGLQFKNAGEEMGVAVELARVVQSTISREEVKKVIEMVMDQEGKGGDMKKKAEEIAEHIKAAVREDGE